MPFFPTAIAGLAMISAAIAEPTPAPTDDGREAVAAHYFAPPDTTAVQSVLDDQALRDAGIVSLARAIGSVEDALASCKTIRYQMTSLIGDNYGSYSVHPDWVEAYRNCLTTRFDETGRLKTAIDARRQALMGSNDGEAALRAADVMARLSVYQIKTRKAVEAEVAAQKAFVAYYNTGVLPDSLKGPDGTPMIGDAATSESQ